MIGPFGKKRARPIPVTETARFGSGYETVNRYVGRRAVSPLAVRVNAVMMPAAVALTIMAIMDVRSDVRMWLSVLLILFGPGSALVQYFRIPDAALQLGLILTISTATGILLAQILLWFNNFDAVLASGILTVLTFLHPVRRQNPLPKAESKTEAKA